MQTMLSRHLNFLNDMARCIPLDSIKQNLDHEIIPLHFQWLIIQFRTIFVKNFLKMNISNLEEAALMIFLQHGIKVIL